MRDKIIQSEVGIQNLCRMEIEGRRSVCSGDWNKWKRRKGKDFRMKRCEQTQKGVNHDWHFIMYIHQNPPSAHNPL